VFAHGSSVESANEAVREVCRAMAQAGGHWVQAAFLEGGKPDLRSAVRAAADEGAERVVVIPYFLTLGLHLKRDLPKLVHEVEAEHPKVRVTVTPPLDGHASLVRILLERAEGALNEATA
jgi:sirohydrochlorin ferrochelatase